MCPLAGRDVWEQQGGACAGPHVTVLTGQLAPLPTSPPLSKAEERTLTAQNQVCGSHGLIGPWEIG